MADDVLERDIPTLAGKLAEQIQWGLSVQGITARDKVVLLALIMRADRYTGYCYPSTSKVCEDTNIPRECVSRSTQNLKRHGLIDIERRGKKRSNFYAVKWPGWDY